VDINARANAFEAAIGSGRHYDPAKVVSVREARVGRCHRPDRPREDGDPERHRALDGARAIAR
jgi:hypothetical protein